MKLGRKGLHITIRQFFDDTLVFLQPTLESVMMLKGVLRCFEVAIGLKVNFHKSQLIGLVLCPKINVLFYLPSTNKFMLQRFFLSLKYLKDSN